MKTSCVPAPETVRKVGLDDFAFRRGRTYGTILGELETHQVIDLLPDRTPATVSAWLQAYPEIEVISRDRGRDSTIGAREGAPQAMHVADRWHLIHHLSETLALLLEQYRRELRTLSHVLIPPQPLSQKEEPLPKIDPTTPLLVITGPSYRSPALQAIQDARRSQRVDRYEHVMTLQQQGMSLTKGGELIGVNPPTVRRW